uniref:Uncharacterized protein n=1 Tax=Anguilla anguilla TaxID=7936 RepID=A0A0E9U718_ANGAN
MERFLTLTLLWKLFHFLAVVNETISQLIELTLAIDLKK